MSHYRTKINFEWPHAFRIAIPYASSSISSAVFDFTACNMTLTNERRSCHRCRYLIKNKGHVNVRENWYTKRLRKLRRNMHSKTTTTTTISYGNIFYCLRKWIHVSELQADLQRRWKCNNIKIQTDIQGIRFLLKKTNLEVSSDIFFEFDNPNFWWVQSSDKYILVHR